MRLLKQCSIWIFSVLSAFAMGACAHSDMNVYDESVLAGKGGDGGPFSGKSLDEKIQRLRTIRGIEVHGTINVNGRGKDIQGSFVMAINGDDIDMVIHSKGIIAGRIDLKGNIVNTSPSLKDEYIEYMFAVILRDAVTWWNIYEYDIAQFDRHFIMRNSWKKLYVSSVTLVPEKQVVRLTKQREIVITYGDIRDLGFGLMPATILFAYDDLKCRLSLTHLEIHEVIRQSGARDLLQQY